MSNNKLQRPITVPSKNEAIAGVSIKQVKDILMSEDLSQVLSLYSLMMQRDLHLSATLQTRRDQLQSLSYKIDGKKEMVSFAKSYLESIKFNLLLQDLSSSLESGFCVLDLLWGATTIDNKISFVPTRLKLLSSRYFEYDNKKSSDIEALYFTIKNKKRYLSSLDSRKVLLHCHQSDTEHITKYSPLYKVAWFVALKHQVIASNMQWFDSLGIPPLIINQDTADEKELESVLYQALSLRSNAVGIFPKGVDIKLLAGGVSSKADFLSFIEYVDEQVSFFITGQVLATSSKSSGSYAQAKVHENRLSEKQSFDAKLIGSTITDLLNKVISVNFLDSNEVRFEFIIKEHKDLKNSSEIIKNLEESGFEVPTSHIEQHFGIKGVKRKKTDIESNGVAPSEAVTYNAVAKKLPLDKTTAQLKGMDLSGVEEGLKRHLIEAINQAKSYEEVYDILSDNKSVDIDKLEELLAKYIANAMFEGVDDGKD